MNLEGREIGGCKLIRKIGAGGMGEVYLAEQRRVGNRHVAVKVVSPEDASFHKEVVDDIALRFEREAALLGQLSHPNILPVHDSGVEGTYLYLVMEYAPEGSLTDAIRGNARQQLELPLPLARAIDFIGQIASALQYTHDHGVVHRDVKPGNVLVRIEKDGHWHLLLADFGVARSLETTSQRTQVTGTFAYMAPEQFSAKFSPASDQYALGVMAFLLLAGRTPFEGDLAALTRAHMFEQPPSLHLLNPAVPPAVEAVVNRALAKDPSQRYPTVADFASALRAAAAPQTAQQGDTAVADVSTVAAAAPVIVPPPLPIIPEQRAPGQPAPQWPPQPTPTPADQRQRRQRSPWRIPAAILAALVLLVAVAAGLGAFPGIPGLRGQGNIQPTNTTVPKPTSTATQPASTISVSPIPTCGTPQGISSNITCAPQPPIQVGPRIISSHIPECQSDGVSWTASDATKIDCDTDKNHLLLTPKVSGQLACLNAQDNPIPDAYVTVIAAPQSPVGSSNVVLAFRQGKGDSTPGTPGTNHIAGYYFGVYTDTNRYALYTIDASGKPNSVPNGSGSIPATLADSFALGVYYKANTIQLYINNHMLASVTDTTFTTGWVGICADKGPVGFSDMQVYSLPQS
ncbi:MAG TPA: serine/threonine-protein kinase [Ktedonobacterales bacterium]